MQVNVRRQRVKQRAEAGFRISDFMVMVVRTWYCKLSCLAKTNATECNQRNSIKVHTKHVVQPCLQTLRIQVSGPFLESSSNFCAVEGKLHASARNKTKIFRNMSSDPNNRCSKDDLAIDMLSGKSRACTLKVSTRILRCLHSFQLSTKSIRNFECSTTGRFAATPPHNLLQPKRSV